MKSERQQLLLRKMRRSLIALQIQTPQPVFEKIPVRWYFSTIALVVFLTAVISTRAALIYRAEVGSTQARVLYVEKSNAERRQARVAALTAFEQKVDPIIASEIELPVVDPKPVIVAKVAPVREVVAKRVVLPPKPAFEIKSRYADLVAPDSIDEAFDRLRGGADELALSWLLDKPEQFRNSAAWHSFQQVSNTGDSAEHHFQLGVLYGAIGEEVKAYRWSASAVAMNAKPAFVRSLAVSADRLGKTDEAIKAYSRFLAIAPSDEMPEVRQRLAVLESR